MRRKEANQSVLSKGVSETPLGISLEVKPCVTLDIPANGLDRSLSEAQNALRSDECISLVY